MSAILELVGVSKTFPSDPPVEPLRGLDMRVDAGELVVVTGVSGKGKSTLLNVAGGLLAPTSGAVLFAGEDLASASAARLDALHTCGIGYIFQVPSVFAALTVRENLEFAARLVDAAKPAAQSSPARSRIDSLLADFGLSEREHHMPHELSVGQKRRLVVARSLLADHALLLADEPTNDLDDAWSDYVFDRFGAFARSGERAVVVVTHDERYARRASRVLELDEGRLRER